MDKTYQPHDIETKLYQLWEQNGDLKPTTNAETSYALVIPPPNVTGNLHMGHGFQHAVMDSLIRHQRMLGYNTLWQTGVDHAGIATQMVVERQLEAEGSSRDEIGRENFIQRVWDWKAQSGSQITQQIRRLGNSIDWSRERFTMDDDFSRTVREVFVQLYDEDIIYRGKRLVNWDPKFLSAISDLEVIQEEENVTLWYIDYPIADTDEKIRVATTRPETLLGDAAIAVHPDDERYQHLIGKHAIIPITEREIPIIADEYVESSFGTGCVKITPAHDFNDFDMGKRHDLPLINILHPNATLNDQVPTDYQGLDRYEARKKLIAELETLNLLAKSEDYKTTLPRGDRSGVVLEPYLTDQWYVKADVLAGPAIDAVKSGEIRFVPENWSNTYFQWMENIQDWCISRQLWWGHRIPAWYDESGNIYVATDENNLKEKYHLESIDHLTQDDDVLDTWFSSALWPFVTLGWPDDLETFKRYYPTQVLVTGFDIIFFWVARMIMMSLKFTGKVPFREVYITGLIRDTDGQKMSKSKGNVLDPLDIIDGIELEDLVQKRCSAMMQPMLAKRIEKQTRSQFPDGIKAYGTDALRFTYCALATPGRNIRFDLARVEGYRNFCNKIWNAARFVLMNASEHAADLLDGPIEYSLADKWIKTQYQKTVQLVERYFASYRFDLLTQCLYDFIWSQYCDWYLELTKPILYAENSTNAQKRGTRQILLEILEGFLRLTHPIMPFITEEIWQKVAPLLGITGKSIMVKSYPLFDATQEDTDASEAIEWLKKGITAIRNIRGEMNISPNQPVPLYFAHGNEQDKAYLDQTQGYIQSLAKCESIHWLEANDSKPVSATALINDLEVMIPMAGLIDKQAELNRLNKELTKIKKDKERVQGKLANPNYLNKAPADIVEQEKQKFEQLVISQERIKALVDKMEAL